MKLSVNQSGFVSSHETQFDVVHASTSTRIDDQCLFWVLKMKDLTWSSPDLKSSMVNWKPVFVVKKVAMYAGLMSLRKSAKETSQVAKSAATKE